MTTALAMKRLITPTTGLLQACLLLLTMTSTGDALAHGTHAKLNKYCADKYGTDIPLIDDKKLPQPWAAYNKEEGHWECVFPNFDPGRINNRVIAFHPKVVCKAQVNTNKVHFHSSDKGRVDKESSVHCGKVDGWVNDARPAPAARNWSAAGFDTDGNYAWAVGYASETAALDAMRGSCTGRCDQTLTTDEQCLSVVTVPMNGYWFTGTGNTQDEADTIANEACSKYFMYCFTRISKCR